MIILNALKKGFLLIVLVVVSFNFGYKLGINTKSDEVKELNVCADEIIRKLTDLDNKITRLQQEQSQEQKPKSQEQKPKNQEQKPN